MSEIQFLNVDLELESKQDISVPDSNPISNVLREQLNHCFNALREHDSISSQIWFIALSGGRPKKSRNVFTL